jgi:hypothetical protein
MASYLTSQGHVHSAYDGMSVKNVYTNDAAHRQVLYSQDETLYNSHLVCANGVANPDNACLCNGSPNSAPFNAERHNLMKELFVPENPNTFPYPGNAARCVMAERSPYGKRYPYQPMLGSCAYGNKCQ